MSEPTQELTAHGHESHPRQQLPPRDPNGEYQRLSTKPSFVTQSQSPSDCADSRTPSATTNIHQQPRDPNGEYQRLSTKPSFVTQSQSPSDCADSRTPSATTNIHQQPRDPNDHTVYIGKKPPMSYVIAVVTRFNNGDSEVKVKARGRNISVAADVTQIVKNRFIPTLKIKNVDITTEELTSDDGRMLRVSSMQIAMTK